MVDTFDAPLFIADKFNRRYINREKLGENYFVLRMDDYPLQVPAGQQAMSAFSVPEDAGHAGDFEACGLVGFGTAPFRLTMSEVGVEANAFMNNPIHHNHAVGLAGLPFEFAETIFLLAGKIVQVQVFNLSATLQNNVRLALIGRKFNNEMSPDVRERRAAFLANRPTRAYWLTLDRTSLTLAAGATNAEDTMTIPSGSHFVADSIMAESTGPFEFALFDAQGGRQLTQGQTGGIGFVDSRIFAGTAQLPAKMLGSPLIQPRRSIRVVANDLANNGNNVIHITMHGRRIRMPVG